MNLRKPGPTAARRFSAARCAGWGLLALVAWPLGLLKSVTFLSLISLWNLVETSYSAWRADVPTPPEA